MNELHELIESLTRDAWRLLVLERDLENPRILLTDKVEMLKEYRKLSTRVFDTVRADRREERMNSERIL